MHQPLYQDSTQSLILNFNWQQSGPHQAKTKEKAKIKKKKKKKKKKEHSHREKATCISL